MPKTPDITHYFWLRDERRSPVAVVAYQATGLLGTHALHYAVATRNPKDTFSKVTARQVAVGRLTNVSTGPICRHALRYEHRIAIRKAIMKNKSLPNAARKAAALWFQSWPNVERRKGSNRKADRREQC